MIERYSRPEMANIWSEENNTVLGLRWKSWLTKHGLSWEKSLRKMWL